MAYISKINITDGSSYDIRSKKTAAIPFGTVTQISVTTLKVTFNATVEGITELFDGVCCFVSRSSGDSIYLMSAYLNVNNLGSKPIYATDGSGASMFPFGKTMFFIYNSTRISGGCWEMYVTGSGGGSSEDPSTIYLDILWSEYDNALYVDMTYDGVMSMINDGINVIFRYELIFDDAPSNVYVYYDIEMISQYEGDEFITILNTFQDIYGDYGDALPAMLYLEEDTLSSLGFNVLIVGDSYSSYYMWNNNKIKTVELWHGTDISDEAKYGIDYSFDSLMDLLFFESRHPIIEEYYTDEFDNSRMRTYRIADINDDLGQVTIVSEPTELLNSNNYEIGYGIKVLVLSDDTSYGQTRLTVPDSDVQTFYLDNYVPSFISTGIAFRNEANRISSTLEDGIELRVERTTGNLLNQLEKTSSIIQDCDVINVSFTSGNTETTALTIDSYGPQLPYTTSMTGLSNSYAASKGYVDTLVGNIESLLTAI